MTCEPPDPALRQRLDTGTGPSQCQHADSPHLCEQTVGALSGIIQAKPREASLENLLCEMVVTKVGPAAVFPSKLGAIAQLAKICGWNEPEKHEHCASNQLPKLLKRLRGS